MHRLLKPAAVAALLIAGSVSGQTMSPDMFPGAPVGTLTVRMELQGLARNNLPNGVEWNALKTSRSLELRLAMLDHGNSSAPTVSIGGRQIRHGDAKSMMSPEAAGMAAAIEACNGDQACQMMTMMKLAPKMQEMQGAAEGTGGVIGGGRYRNWIGDRRTAACAEGTIEVSDIGDGMAISPPSPAAYYKFQRSGKAVLPDGEEKTVEAACAAEVTFDLQEKTASIKLPVRGLSVPVKLSGQAFTKERAVAFLEGVNAIEILDQTATQVSGWSGETTMAIGSVSHNSGSVTVPVTAKISWRFETES